MTATLVAMPYSPWSERAKWALNHHSVPYKRVLHVPMVFEPGIRSVRAWFKKDPSLLLQQASVPMLIDRGQLFDDSLTIAEHADRIGSGKLLIPSEHRPQVLEVVEGVDRALGVARNLLFVRMLKDEDAIMEQVPKELGVLGPLRMPLAKVGVRFTQSKYLGPENEESALEERLAHEFELFENLLDGKDYVLGSFGFADIVLASSLAMLRPRDDAPLGPATRRTWSNERLAEKHARLLDYRERIYQEHRRPN